MTGSAGTLVLEGLGDLLPDTPVTLELTGAGPGADAWLVVGRDDLLQPFQGGVLVPRPDLVVGGMLTDATGSLRLDATWPPGVPTESLSWYQVWVAEAGALVGSNGLLSVAGE